MTLGDGSEWFRVEQLAENLYGIGEPAYLEEVNSFLLIGEKEALLFDTGCGFYSMKQCVEGLTDRPVRVLNTHSHFDHVGSNFEFSEVEMFDHPNNRRAALEGFDNGYLAEWSAEDKFFGERPSDIPDPYIIPPFPTASFFNEGNVQGTGLQAIHTPGHSDCSVSFYDQERGWLFAGDLLYDGPILIEKAAGSLQKFRRSVERVAGLEPLNRIFSCHNYFEFSLEKLALLRAALSDLKSEELEEDLVIEGRLSLALYVDD